MKSKAIQQLALAQLLSKHFVSMSLPGLSLDYWVPPHDSLPLFDIIAPHPPNQTGRKSGLTDFLTPLLSPEGNAFKGFKSPSSSENGKDLDLPLDQLERLSSQMVQSLFDWLEYLELHTQPGASINPQELERLFKKTAPFLEEAQFILKIDTRDRITFLSSFFDHLNDGIGATIGATMLQVLTLILPTETFCRTIFETYQTLNVRKRRFFRFLLGSAAQKPPIILLSDVDDYWNTSRFINNWANAFRKTIKEFPLSKWSKLFQSFDAEELAQSPLVCDFIIKEPELCSQFLTLLSTANHTQGLLTLSVFFKEDSAPPSVLRPYVSSLLKIEHDIQSSLKSIVDCPQTLLQQSKKNWFSHNIKTIETHLFDIQCIQLSIFKKTILSSETLSLLVETIFLALSLSISDAMRLFQQLASLVYADPESMSLISDKFSPSQELVEKQLFASQAQGSEYERYLANVILFNHQLIQQRPVPQLSSIQNALVTCAKMSASLLKSPTLPIPKRRELINSFFDQWKPAILSHFPDGIKIELEKRSIDGVLQQAKNQELSLYQYYLCNLTLFLLEGYESDQDYFPMYYSIDILECIKDEDLYEIPYQAFFRAFSDSGSKTLQLKTISRFLQQPSSAFSIPILVETGSLLLKILSNQSDYDENEFFALKLFLEFVQPQYLKQDENLLTIYLKLTILWYSRQYDSSLVFDPMQVMKLGSHQALALHLQHCLDHVRALDPKNYKPKHHEAILDVLNQSEDLIKNLYLFQPKSCVAFSAYIFANASQKDQAHLCKLIQLNPTENTVKKLVVLYQEALTKPHLMEQVELQFFGQLSHAEQLQFVLWVAPYSSPLLKEMLASTKKPGSVSLLLKIKILTQVFQSLASDSHRFKELFLNGFLNRLLSLIQQMKNQKVKGFSRIVKDSKQLLSEVRQFHYYEESLLRLNYLLKTLSFNEVPLESHPSFLGALFLSNIKLLQTFHSESNQEPEFQDQNFQFTLVQQCEALLFSICYRQLEGSYYRFFKELMSAPYGKKVLQSVFSFSDIQPLAVNAIYELSQDETGQLDKALLSDATSALSLFSKIPSHQLPAALSAVKPPSFPDLPAFFKPILAAVKRVTQLSSTQDELIILDGIKKACDNDKIGLDSFLHFLITHHSSLFETLLQQQGLGVFIADWVCRHEGPIYSLKGLLTFEKFRHEVCELKIERIFSRPELCKIRLSAPSFLDFSSMTYDQFYECCVFFYQENDLDLICNLWENCKKHFTTLFSIPAVSEVSLFDAHQPFPMTSAIQSSLYNALSPVQKQDIASIQAYVPYPYLFQLGQHFETAKSTLKGLCCKKMDAESFLKELKSLGFVTEEVVSNQSEAIEDLFNNPAYISEMTLFVKDYPALFQILLSFPAIQTLVTNMHDSCVDSLFYQGLYLAVESLSPSDALSLIKALVRSRLKGKENIESDHFLEFYSHKPSLDRVELLSNQLLSHNALQHNSHCLALLQASLTSLRHSFTDYHPLSELQAIKMQNSHSRFYIDLLLEEFVSSEDSIEKFLCYLFRQDETPFFHFLSEGALSASSILDLLFLQISTDEHRNQLLTYISLNAYRYLQEKNTVLPIDTLSIFYRYSPLIGKKLLPAFLSQSKALTTEQVSHCIQCNLFSDQEKRHLLNSSLQQSSLQEGIAILKASIPKPYLGFLFPTFLSSSDTLSELVGQDSDSKSFNEFLRLLFQHFLKDPYALRHLNLNKDALFSDLFTQSFIQMLETQQNRQNPEIISEQLKQLSLTALEVQQPLMSHCVVMFISRQTLLSEHGLSWVCDLLYELPEKPRLNWMKLLILNSPHFFLKHDAKQLNSPLIQAFMEKETLSVDEAEVLNDTVTLFCKLRPKYLSTALQFLTAETLAKLLTNSHTLPKTKEKIIKYLLQESGQYQTSRYPKWRTHLIQTIYDQILSMSSVPPHMLTESIFSLFSVSNNSFYQWMAPYQARLTSFPQVRLVTLKDCQKDVIDAMQSVHSEARISPTDIRRVCFKLLEQGYSLLQILYTSRAMQHDFPGFFECLKQVLNPSLTQNQGSKNPLVETIRSHLDDMSFCKELALIGRLLNLSFKGFDHFQVSLLKGKMRALLDFSYMPLFNLIFGDETDQGLYNLLKQIPTPVHESAFKKYGIDPESARRLLIQLKNEGHLVSATKLKPRLNEASLLLDMPQNKREQYCKALLFHQKSYIYSLIRTIKVQSDLYRLLISKNAIPELLILRLFNHNQTAKWSVIERSIKSAPILNTRLQALLHDQFSQPENQPVSRESLKHVCFALFTQQTAINEATKTHLSLPVVTTSDHLVGLLETMAHAHAQETHIPPYNSPQITLQENMVTHS